MLTETPSICVGTSISHLARATLAVLGSLAVLSSAVCAYRPRALQASSADDLQVLLSYEPSDPNRFNPHNGSLLSPFMIPRVSGTVNNTIVQKFILDYFQKLNESSIAGQPFNGILIEPSTVQDGDQQDPTTINEQESVVNGKEKRAPLPNVEYKGSGWHVELDSFEDDTPYGKKKFTNIVMTKNPNAEKRIVFAAHFDSKYFPPTNNLQQNNGGEDTLPFIAATDSAAPCAILLDLATSLDRLLDHPSRTDKDTTLQIIFFDGEEAFVDWHGTDNTYGSRHLAELWANTTVPKTRIATGRNGGDKANKLDGIELLVLLDLLGAENPNVPNWFAQTTWAHTHALKIEERLWSAGLHTKGPKLGGENDDGDNLEDDLKAHMFDATAYNGGIADDHLSFLHRGVPIFHVIPFPFPDVWHKLNDNADAIDPDVVKNWANLFRVFAAEYLNLIPGQPNGRRRDEL